MRNRKTKDSPYKPFEIHRDKKNEFRVYLVEPGTRRVLAWSEGYQTKAGAKRCIGRIIWSKCSISIQVERHMKGYPKYYMRINGLNNRKMMRSRSDVLIANTKTIVLRVIDVQETFNPDTMTFIPFYYDESYLTPDPDKEEPYEVN